MPRFVILRHETTDSDCGPVHWDFMLETNEVLRTWALSDQPSPGIEIAAHQLPDHRLAYLDYEGPISGHRGTVTRWDTGEYQLAGQSTDELQISLQGQKLSGDVLLRRAEEPQRWRFTFST